MKVIGKIAIVAVVVWVAIGLVVLFVETFSIEAGHEFVSEDGGFVMKSDLKTPVDEVEDYFHRYQFLRSNPQLKLYRTTKVNALKWFSKAAKYEFKPYAKKAPVDWWEQLSRKCVDEYIPTLPTVLQTSDVRFFFFNQYDCKEVTIYGQSLGKIFALEIRNDPDRSASGKEWDSPVWSSTQGIDIQEPHWQDVWQFVNVHKQELLEAWDRDREKLIKKFEPEYDQLF
jgi:hypothetical protein